MENEKKNGGLIIILIILILGLTGYIIYDKVISKKEISKSTTTTTSNIKIKSVEDLKNAKSEVNSVALNELLTDEELKTNFTSIDKDYKGLKINYKCTEYLSDVNAPKEINNNCQSVDITINKTLKYSDSTTKLLDADCNKSKDVYYTNRYVAIITLDGCTDIGTVDFYNLDGTKKLTSTISYSDGVVKADGSSDEIMPKVIGNNLYYISIIDAANGKLKLVSVDLNKSTLVIDTIKEFTGRVGQQS